MPSTAANQRGVAAPEQRALTADLLEPGPLRSLERLWQIFRHYRKRQLFQRAWKIATCRLSPTRVLPQVTRVQPRDDMRSVFRELLRTRTPRCEGEPVRFMRDFEAGTFTLLSERRALRRPVPWSAGLRPGGERHWEFQLQYHEYLLDAALVGGDDAWGTIAGLLDEWLQAYSDTRIHTSDDAWHPYCISRRVPVWLMLLATDNLPHDLRERMLVSLATQAEWLHQNLETDLGGNHLLENAHALALVALALAAATNQREGVQHEWLTTACKIFDTELPQQILAHGEHCERSPMYHAQVLGNLLQVAIAARMAAPELSQSCSGWAESMWVFLESILHPDGEIPLFGDSCFGESYPVSQIRKLLSAVKAGAEPTGPTYTSRRRTDQPHAPKPSPYWVWRDGNDAWIVDGGAAVENSLPAHGHCDLGGFEASIDGVRWFVDAGVFGYSDDLMRRYCRASLAHNVATVNDRNQFDAWFRFRLGYRVQPQFEQGQANGVKWAHISHDAYRRLGAGRMHRIVAVTPAGDWLCIDHCRCPHPRRIVGNLLLGPEISVEPESNEKWLLESARQRRVLQFLGTSKVECRQSWYAPRFGTRMLVNSLHYESGPADPAGIAWMLCKDRLQEPSFIRFEPHGRNVIAAFVTGQQQVLCQWELKQ